MQELFFHSIDMAQIDAADWLFSLQPLVSSVELATSVAQIGIAQPLRLQERQDHLFRIVSGFRRFEAAQNAGLMQVPAFIHDFAEDNLQLFKWVLAEKSYAKPLNPLQVSYAMAHLKIDFSLSDEDILCVFFPLMRLAPNPKLHTLYAPLKNLELPLQLLIMQDELSIEIAAALARRSIRDQHCYQNLLHALRLGKNRQREFWMLLTDIERMQNTSFAEMLEKSPLADILAEPSLTPSQKSDKLKLALMHLRYPTYSATLDRYEQILHRAKLPPDIHLHPTPYFASDRFHVDLSFRTSRELAQRLKVLEAMLDRGLVDELTDLV